MNVTLPDVITLSLQLFALFNVAAIAANPDQELLLYCAYGERSALAYSEMHEAGLVNTCHLAGGIDAWINSGAKVEAPGPG